MKTYCVYMTIYLGDKMPPFYIGSTCLEKINKGYKGSVSSAKWKTIWKDEIKNDPNLFRTYIITEQFRESKNEILLLEKKWQEIFDAVNDGLFVNLSYATKGFCSTPESIRKTVETRRKRGTDKLSMEAKKKISESKLKDKNPMYGKVVWKEAGLQNPMTGRKHTLESREKMSTAFAKSYTAEHKKQRSERMTGSNNPSYGKPAVNRRPVIFWNIQFDCISDACKHFNVYKTIVYKEGIFKDVLK